MKRIIGIGILCLCCILKGQTQVVALKSNVLYDASTTFNLGCEVAMTKHWSLDVSGDYNPWKFGSDDKSIKHWLVQPELRYWFHEHYNRSFVGLHGMYIDYNTSGVSLLNVMKSGYDYDGQAYGCGLSYGYHLYMSAHWNVEFTAGLGYIRFKYDKSLPADGSNSVRYKNNYFGPTKVGVSFVYLIR
ncbi:MAG: DUF3575 domain-containing protein [Parabacteroides sp.]|nr:DUF3575 domain-containing protein [Parabacteroides sp.]